MTSRQSFMRGSIVLALVTTCLLTIIPRNAESDEDLAPLPDPAKGRMNFYSTLEIDAQGDADSRQEIHFSEFDWAGVMKFSSDPRRWLQDMPGNRSEEEIAGLPEARYDPSKRSVIVTMRKLAYATHQGNGKWSLSKEFNPGTKSQLRKRSQVDGRVRVIIDWNGPWLDGERIYGRNDYLLPAQATDVMWDTATETLTWTTPVAPPTRAPTISMRLRTKDRLMTTPYKAYGLQGYFGSHWVAKAVLRNTGGAIAHDVRVRFRLDRFSEWSPWARKGDLLPGQTSVEPYYPVILDTAATLRSNTPADLRVEWSWQDAAGAKKSDEDAGRITLLGVNEFVFSNLTPAESFGTWQEAINNAPLLAAWVTRDDPVIKQLAAMANRSAGGLGSDSNDLSTLQLISACYNLLQANSIAYQTPASLVDKSVSFDPQIVQHVKLPRDVIRDRSGTCIDLAILMASMGYSLGIKTYLALLPGHCMPAFLLPSGTIMPIEATGVTQSAANNPPSALQAMKSASETWTAARTDGRLELIDITDLWARGVSSPELERLPPDILKVWGIHESPPNGTSGQARPDPTLADAPPPVPETPPAIADSDPHVGLYSGSFRATVEGGKVQDLKMSLQIVTNEVGYSFAAATDMKMPTRGMAQEDWIVFDIGAGTAQGGRLVLNSFARVAFSPTTGRSKLLTGTIQVIVGLERDAIAGTFGDASVSPAARAKIRLPRSSAPQQAMLAWDGEWRMHGMPPNRAMAYPGHEHVINVKFQSWMNLISIASIQTHTFEVSAQGDKHLGWYDEIAIAGLKSDGIVFRVVARKFFDAESGKSVEDFAQNELQLTRKGKELHGRYGSDDEGWSAIVLKRFR